MPQSQPAARQSHFIIHANNIFIWHSPILGFLFCSQPCFTQRPCSTSNRRKFGVFCCVTSWQSQVRISQVVPLCNFQLLRQTQQTSSCQLHAPTPSYPKRHQTVFQFPTTNSSANHHTHLVTNFRTFASKLFRGT